MKSTRRKKSRRKCKLRKTSKVYGRTDPFAQNPSEVKRPEVKKEEVKKEVKEPKGKERVGATGEWVCLRS